MQQGPSRANTKEAKEEEQSQTHSSNHSDPDEGKWLEPIIKAYTSLSLMVKLKEIGPSLLFKEDDVEELYTLNI